MSNALTTSRGIVISAENVSKSFVLRRNRVLSLRDRLAFGRPKLQAEPASEVFWALRDVSFSIRAGESVGIVGHNGSGKSTMLKILTGIMKPTQGKIRVRGRIGALIEVGAGFHPDLSGRENIYLNGSILGLSRKEVAARFDEIVAFAGLERFVDTPVKRYSSGMYMRLGFSIAVHTNPDVLLIDEVLAVGDTLFQRKCLRRLEQFVADGGAAVFVSHAMAQVAELCKTCVWLDHGQARYIGETSQAIEQYMAVVAEREDAELKREHPEEWAALKEEEESVAREEAERAEREALQRAEEAERTAPENQGAARFSPQNRPKILGVRALDRFGDESRHFDAGDALTLRIGYQFIEKPTSPTFGLEFYREDGLYCFGTSNFDHGVTYPVLPMKGEAVIAVDFLSLNSGEYRIRLRLWADNTREGWPQDADDVVEDAGRIFVNLSPFAHGCVYLPVTWRPAPEPLLGDITLSLPDSPVLPVLAG